MKIQINKINKIYILIAIIVIIVGYGIYKNPDRKSNRINSELENLLGNSFSSVQEMANSMYQNKNCFSFESFQNLDSKNCIVVIENAKNNFEKLNAETLGKTQEFYDSRKDELEGDTKKFIENALVLYESKPYLSLLNSYNEFFISAIELHRSLLKGISNMTPAEKKTLEKIADDFDKKSNDLRSTTISFNEYLNNNFDVEFVKMMNETGQSIKKSANQ